MKLRPATPADAPEVVRVYVDPTLGELDTISVDPTQWRGGVGRWWDPCRGRQVSFRRSVQGVADQSQ
ncbi:GNAT family N-acetyltransferase [Tenggerimyces flavus]|uniref:Acetyltransferase n=1 Tax=Tenggerimyces flavus TaxID=1708749 RepID=A0ABV7YJS1_9ACTN|nr:hypothetical protein [Tenggerimyces flavus]MBM7787673.1 hypothetical protein [Tenggerimyces flavus]